MPQISHLAPTNIQLPPRPAHEEVSLLADAFSDFIAASTKLESSYRDLQVEVGQLGSELASRNAELEASLCRNEQMRLVLAEIVDSMPCGVLVLAEKEQVLRINAEARRILALPGEQPDPADLEAVRRRSSVDLAPFCAIEGEHEFSFLPVQNAEGKGAKRWIELRTRRLASFASEVQTILILSDVSAHKQAEQDRETGRRALALAEVAATLAHEIRNPLASLELFVELLEDEPGRSTEWTAHLRAGLRALAATVNNVLSYHGASFPHLRSIVVGESIAAAVEFIRPIARQAGLVLVMEGAELPGEALANQAGLQQVISNLVVNAVRHTAAGGLLTVTLSRSSASSMLLKVTDTGCGIAPEDLASVFEPGWSARGASTGLGLAVCQRIAAQHGTVLHIASVPGRGTTCAMELAIL